MLQPIHSSAFVKSRNRGTGALLPVQGQSVIRLLGWVSAFHLGPRSPLEPRSACGAHCRARLVSSYFNDRVFILSLRAHLRTNCLL